MYHPPRGGVRGGRDQFNWEDVKTDKHRENYLGHSLFAPVGRWQKGKDLTWYSKDGKSEQAYLDEINAIKDAEADVMAEFLGAGKRKKVTGNVTQQELSNVLKREQEDDDDDEILKEATKDATKGLGFKSFGRLHIDEMIPADSETIENGSALKNDEQIIQSDKDYSINTSAVTSDNLTGKSAVSKKPKKEKKKKRKKHKKDSRSPSPVRKRYRDYRTPSPVRKRSRGSRSPSPARKRSQDRSYTSDRKDRYSSRHHYDDDERSRKYGHKSSRRHHSSEDDRKDL